MSESTEYIAGGDIISRGGGALIYPHNKYYSVDEIRKLEDGAELEALTANGKHYYVVYHRTKGTAEQIHLSYPNWGSEYDFRGDITNCCLTWRGHYSSAAGLNRKTNTYSSQNMLPVVIGIGKIVNPRHKYYSREEIRNLPDRSKVDILTAENGNLIHVHGLYRCPLEGNPYIHYPNWSDSFNTTGDVFDMCLSDRGAYSNGDMRHRKELCASVAVASSKRSRESPSVSGTLKRLPQAQRERYNPEDLSHSRVKNARRVLNTDAVYSSPAASALETALNFSDSSVDEVDMMLLFENEFSNDYKVAENKMVDSKSSSLLSTDIAIVSPMCTKESVGRCVEASLLTEIPSLLQLAEDRVDAVLKLRQSLGVCESNLDIFNNAWPSLAHSHKAMTQFIVRASCANTSSLISSNSEMLRTRTLSDLDALRIKIKSDLLHLQNMLYIEIQEMASDEHQLIELKVKIKNDLYR